ncbi:sensor histidine kinase [Shewanella sp. GutDb-MelDb]|uniref:sensor histidine kinase n=1 Tax=Shewanella sp. GutDb-MelDb TaxID=2058316 RepID=UPI000C7A9F95|nr:sensor histidine kinase [Shewanella sp. GutDb-MelDb]PKG57759.1 sensor histidine kinase [Shewanella sp. GutDb-MelDb]
MMIKRWFRYGFHILVWMIALLSLPVSATTTAAANTPNVDIGVLATRGHLYTKQRWQPTIDWLNLQIPEVNFVLHPLDLDTMANAVSQQTMDFVLTNPGQSVTLGRQYALSWIATLTNRAPSSTNFGIGSALVVRASSDYQRPEDIVGLPMAAVSENAFGGYLTLRYEMVQQGINPNDFFADVHYLGFPIDANLYQLRDRNVEAAVIPVCLLENMVKEGLLNKAKFRVLNPKENGHFTCQVSTPLYPNWSLAKTERGSAQLAKKISRILLSMSAENTAAIAAGASGWTSSVNLLSIDKVYQALDLLPLQQPWWKQALRWLRIHQEWAWALFIFFIFINVYHFWLEYRFSKSKQALEQTLHRLKEKGEMLEHSQRVAIVGELGSSLAHEINQPLTAIRNYSEGGLLRLAKQRPYEDIIPVFDKIQSEVERADAIVNRLRTLITKRTVKKKMCDIEQLLNDTIELLHFRLQKQEVVIARELTGTAVKTVVDVVGLQQVMINVINNAIDACMTYLERHPAEGYQANIIVRTHYQQDTISIEIVDNGTGLEHDNPTEAFVSTKTDGLGLGLAICRDVMEMHGGEFMIQSLESKGCIVTISLPVLSTINNRR